MRELDQIRRALAAALARGEAAVLATVMGVDGSVYRGTGARMVVSASGETTGAVSGGCLEADIVARTPDLIIAQKSQLIEYDTRVSDDVVLGLGLGCQGVIDVLLEPLAGESLTQAIHFYDELTARRDPVTLVTLIRDASDDIPLGTRALLDEGGSLIRGDGRILERTGTAREVVRPAIPLVICGAGSDAIPLATLAKSMGWHVTVVDHRAAFVTAERFPTADARVCVNTVADPAALAANVELDHRTMAISMAHSVTHDRAYVHALLDANAAYIGVLGPRRRTVELLGERMSGSSDLPPNVHSPVGLDIGAEAPDEIALAIVAEIASVSNGRRGGQLRNRDGPIHDRRKERALPLVSG